VRFVLDVELEGGTYAEDLNYIFRYWAAHFHEYTLSSGLSVDVFDAARDKVGHWHVSNLPHAEDEDENGYAGAAAGDEDEDGEEDEYDQNDPNASYPAGYDYSDGSSGQY
jgi:hypothetical protein